MTADLSRECRELYRMFGIAPGIEASDLRVDLNETQLIDNEAIVFLREGTKPADTTTPSHVDTLPAKVDS